MDTVGQAHKIAENKVNLAKTSFWRRVGGAVVVGLAAAAMIGLGVATGGVAMLAVGAVTAAAGLRLSADAYMAKLHLENARSEASGQGLVHDLPMGTDAIAHGLYKLCPNTWSKDARTKVARWGSFLADVALAAGTVLATGGVSPVTLGVAGAAVAVVTANHVVLALLRRLPTAREILLGQAPMPERTLGPEEFILESALPKESTLPEKVIDILSRVEQLQLQANELRAGTGKDRIQGEQEALIKQVTADTQWLSQQIENTKASAETGAEETSSATGQALTGAAVVAAVMTANTGMRVGLNAAGVPGVTFANDVLGLALNALTLYRANEDLRRLKDLNSAYAEQLGELSLHQRDLMIKNTNLDGDDFELVFDQPAQGSNMVLPGQLA
ncbi:MAG: hypothetical protein WCK08_05195 [Betaproteobacteria bacterium]